MDIQQFQQLIHRAATAEEMVCIAQCYTEGQVVRDPVAAEAWLLRAVELEDPVWSVRAMGDLARLLGRTEILSDQDLEQILRELPNARGPDRLTLLELQKLATEKQILQFETKTRCNCMNNMLQSNKKELEKK